MKPETEIVFVWIFGVLAGLAVGIALMTYCAPKAQGAPLSYIEMQWYDRPIADPPLHILGPKPGYIESGKPHSQEDFFYRLRTEMHLEVETLPAVPWLSALARIEVRVRGPGSEFGHFEPVSADLGAGAVARLGSWDITLLLASKHGFSFGFYGVTYNSITIRRNL